jgi:hypothetical protein
MTLLELQDILGERISIAIDKTLTMEERQRETELSQTISSLAKQMINNADIVLRTDKLIAQHGYQRPDITGRLVGKRQLEGNKLVCFGLGLSS